MDLFGNLQEFGKTNIKFVDFMGFVEILAQ
jgi:hypothetical protein